jgi:hypothetical protein
MDLYKKLKDIFPYLISIRRLESYVSIDIEIPENWKLIKKYVDEKAVLEQKSNKNGFRLFSFTCEFNELVLDNLFKNILGLIKYNKEREEKERLFEDKVKELKSFFDQKNLNDLKALEFNIKNTLKVELEDDEHEREDSELVSEGDQ